ncbi:hypothetical protein J2Z75_003441 [Rhizobium herbae]|uniref:Uncharacterized protein n=1 Tax=Rhizobium herbae TaxID=508661 RepID=A0ABS4EPQ4_9HYPH|nr:hypothetical protein [Rhizobium herbae]
MRRPNEKRRNRLWDSITHDALLTLAIVMPIAALIYSILQVLT